MLYSWIKEHKYYNVALQLNLFGGISVISSWGSMNNRLGSYKIILCDNEEEVQANLAKIIKRRKARGYQLIHG